MEKIIVADVRNASDEQIINALLKELGYLDPHNAIAFVNSAGYRMWLHDGGWCLASELQASLMEALDSCAADGYFFGVQPQAQYETAQYGWWKLPA